jgi:hypothetical protein
LQKQIPNHNDEPLLNLKEYIRKKKHELSNHLNKANKERKFYKEHIQEGKEDDCVMATSIDYKRGLALPRLKVTPHHIYFINKPTCHVFAVVEEGNTPTESTLFMYGSDLGKQNSRHVVVCLEKYIKKNKT